MIDRELTAEDILGAVDQGELLKVPIPEWDGYVFVRRLTGLEKDAWIDGLSKGEPGKRKASLTNVTAGFVAICACNANRQPLFRDADQVLALGKKFVGALERVANAGRKHNLMDKEDLEDLAKNSEPTQGDAAS